MSRYVRWSGFRRSVEAGGLALLLLAPVCFDAHATGAFEPVKTTLVWLAAVIMAASQLAGWLFADVILIRLLFWTVLALAVAIGLPRSPAPLPATLDL